MPAAMRATHRKYLIARLYFAWRRVFGCSVLGLVRALRGGGPDVFARRVNCGFLTGRQLGNRQFCGATLLSCREPLLSRRTFLIVTNV